MNAGKSSGAQAPGSAAEALAGTGRSPSDESIPNGSGEYVALAAAAAIVYNVVHRMVENDLPRRDYDEALNRAAAALSRIAPVYAWEDSWRGQVELPLDLTRQRFSNGATEVHGNDGQRFSGLLVRRADMLAALPLIQRSRLVLL